MLRITNNFFYNFFRGEGQAIISNGNVVQLYWIYWKKKDELMMESANNQMDVHKLEEVLEEHREN